MRLIRDIFRSYAVLDEQGRHVNGTDKQSNHNYGDTYESLFKQHLSGGRDGVKLMLEIGVADGSCLLAWREVFPNATIVGMDIHPSEKAHGERIEFHLGDQTSINDCFLTANNRVFDVIIEDGTHHLSDSLATFLFLWPYVRRGGLYIIEEFCGVHTLRQHITSMWSNVIILDTVGPFGGIEPLVVFYKG